jgi:hypothetical protein
MILIIKYVYSREVFISFLIIRLMYRMKSFEPTTFTSSRNPSTNLPGALKLCTFAMK